jgi:hypothetical protein
MQLGAKRALGADAAEAHAKPARLTSKVCRERWGQLDAAQWGAVGPNSSPMDVNFRYTHILFNVVPISYSIYIVSMN